MNSLLTVLVLGFLLGMRHATDPDHVIAVGTIVARHQTTRAAALIGFAWGLGHSLSILLVGSAIVAFSWVIPTRVGLSMELTVALMLIVLGLANLWHIPRLFGGRVAPADGGAGHAHTHAHRHGDYVHTHPHRHDPESHPHRPDQTPLAWLDRHFGGVALYHLVRPLVVGIVHGLAGSATVALLVLTAIGNAWWSIFYLVIFGAGTIAGMMLITVAMALPFAFSSGHSAWFAGRLRLASGLISVGFGCLLVYQIGVVHGLFTGYPQWTPR